MLSVPRIAVSRPEDGTHVKTVLRECGVRLTLAETSWREYPYRPRVEVILGWDENHWYLHAEVREKEILGRWLEDNQPVCRDSCVEFFFRPADDGQYYNVEWNCLGTMLLACGTGRHGRTMASPQVCALVKRWPSLPRNVINERRSADELYWHLTAVIPTTALFRHRHEAVRNRKGKRIAANLYKCGDDHAEPHYLSWQRIHTDQPDFHRPESFGELILITSTE